MTTAERLQSIIDSKAAIATAITDKGGTLAASAPLADYAAAVRSIPTGGTERYPLADLGYDPDGSLASSIASTRSRWEGKSPTASYANMFNGDATTRVIPNLDFSQTTSLRQFANGASATQYIPYINALKATDLYAALRLTGAKYCPGINAPLCTDASVIFNGASIEYVGEIILPAATTYRGIFNGAANFFGVGSWQLNQHPDSAETMFYDCKALRNFIEEDFSPDSANMMFVGCTALQEVRMSLRYATNTNAMFGINDSNGCPNCAAWLNWGTWNNSTPTVPKGSLLPAKKYPEDQTTLDFRGLINWGAVSPQSLQYTIDNLPTRRHYEKNGTLNVLTNGPTCNIVFSAATKATLTEAQKSQITSKNYTIA